MKKDFSKWKHWQLAGLVVLLLVAGVVVAGLMRGNGERAKGVAKDSGQQNAQGSPSDESNDQSSTPGRVRESVAPGLTASSTDSLAFPQNPEEHLKRILDRSEPHPGITPFIDPSASDQALDIVEAAKAGEHPERLTFFKKRPFDLEAFRANPQAYTQEVEPGRAYSPASPKDGVTPLALGGKRFSRILQSESVPLVAVAQPGAPVTFHINELGAFDNNLKTMTVLADESGTAQVTYRATKGVIGLVNVVAASPLHSQQLHYMIQVRLPDQTLDLR